MSTLKGRSICFLALTTAFLLAGCQNQEATSLPAPAPAAPPVSTSESPKLAEPTKIGESSKRGSGLVYETLKNGTGPQAQSGDTVTIHCTASAQNGKSFFTTREANHPVTFKLGDSRLIQGWNEGITGMKVGEQAQADDPAQPRLRCLGPVAGHPSQRHSHHRRRDPRSRRAPRGLESPEPGAKFSLPLTDDLYSGKNEWLDTPAKETGKKE